MPEYDPHKHHRHTIRLQGYDYYRPGAYFVTLCTQNRECVLGEIVDDNMNYSAFGQIAHDFWVEVGAHFSHLCVPSFVIMPNHVHAMIVIRDLPPGTDGEVWKPRASVGRGVVSTPQPGQTDPGQGRGVVSTPQPGQADPGPGRGVVSTPQPGQADPGPGRGVVSTPDPGRGDPAPTYGKPDLGHMVAYYKYLTTKRINAQRGNPGTRIWQRNYFEHIVRNDDEYRRIIEYIRTNPLHWGNDQLHPSAAPNPFNQD